MKRTVGLLAGTLAGFAAFGQQLSTNADSLAYALGQDIAKTVLTLKAPVNAEILGKSIVDALNGKEGLFTAEQNQLIIRDALKKAHDNEMASLKKINADFLIENSKKPGVVQLENGLQYVVLKQTEGEKATASDTVTVHYTGEFIDGVSFDNSYERGEPITLPLANVIKGWQLAIPLMAKGSKYRFFIPYDLGYGESGHGTISPFATLIFDIELLDFVKGENVKKNNEGPLAVDQPIQAIPVH